MTYKSKIIIPELLIWNEHLFHILSMLCNQKQVLFDLRIDKSI